MTLQQPGMQPCWQHCGTEQDCCYWSSMFMVGRRVESAGVLICEGVLKLMNLCDPHVLQCGGAAFLPDTG